MREPLLAALSLVEHADEGGEIRLVPDAIVAVSLGLVEPVRPASPCRICQCDERLLPETLEELPGALGMLHVCLPHEQIRPFHFDVG